MEKSSCVPSHCEEEFKLLHSVCDSVGTVPNQMLGIKGSGLMGCLSNFIEKNEAEIENIHKKLDALLEEKTNRDNRPEVIKKKILLIASVMSIISTITGIVSLSNMIFMQRHNQTQQQPSK